MGDGPASRVLALIAVYLATFHDWRGYLAPGERGVIMIIATDRRQARVLFRYVRALLFDVPMLRGMVERETAETIDLTNNITIEIQTASYRSVRGFTLVAALCDEIAFWRGTTRQTPTRRSWRPFAPPWRRSRAPCCSARPRHTRGAGRCGMPIAATTATPTARCWSGRPRLGP